MNVNLNTVMPQVNNAVPTNSKLSTVDSKFLNLLASVMNDSKATSPVNSQQQITGVDMLNILTNMNMMDFADTEGVETLNAQGYIEKPHGEEGSEVKKKFESMMDVVNFINLGNMSKMNFQPEDYSSPEALIMKNDKASSSSMIASSDNKPQNSAQNKALESLLSMKNEPSKMAAMQILKGENKATSVSAEKLIAEIENHRNSFKNEMNMQAEVLTGPRTQSQENNTIINISDESSQIKSQVLSQVKDKIVFMADEGVEHGTSTKQVEMELHPVSLGKVDIKMTFENNKLTVEIKAQNEETQKLISSNADELANILGKTSETVNIVVKSNDYKYEHQLYSYNSAEQKNEELNQDNGGQGRQRNSYYREDKENADDDGVFSQLINIRTIKLNV